MDMVRAAHEPPKDELPAGNLENRLRAARERHGLMSAGDQAVPGKSGAAGLAGVAMRGGVEFASALLVAVVIGLSLDRWLHTKPVLLMVFVLLGFAAGLLNIRRSFVALSAQARDKTEG